MKDHSKSTKLHFWMIQRAISLSLVDSIDLILHSLVDKWYSDILIFPSLIFYICYFLFSIFWWFWCFWCLMFLKLSPWFLPRYSSQLQLRSEPYLLVRLTVPARLVNKIPREPQVGFLSFFAWMFTTIRTRNVHGGFPGKNLDHSIITIQCQKQPFLRVFQLWADFDGNLSHWWSLFML